jgi:2,3-bisphosphoglycerate-independent phosphoglycerate mutase
VKKLLYVCLDGLGDDPVPELDDRTPLEAAETPFLDSLARRGRTGSVVTVGPGIAPESDIAVFAILGYDPRGEHPGRGVVEAVGVGMDFRDGDLAHRVNFATADWPRIVDRRVGATSSESQALAAGEQQLRLPARASAQGDRHGRDLERFPRAAGRLVGVALETFSPRSPGASRSRTPAPHAGRPGHERVRQGSAKILEASEVNVRRRAEGKLPGNLILTRDGGDHRPRLQPIDERFGPRWGCFVEMPVERGIATLLGMAPVDAPRLGDEAAYVRWAELASDALGGYDALYVHIKGPDVPAHDGRALDKRDVIALIDRAFFGEVLPRLDTRNTIVAVTADHSTSCVRKAHTADPVPLVVAGAGVPSDGSEAFGERACARGSLGSLRGVEILPRVAELLQG